ncbi:hypothetical protein [Gimesia fumaroli]|uniref:Uncharacterized protein n=1 Tax=Gimesia fumaroli TaxID=2527976 RepID=A0A518IKU5_9PLAN|nr:hypothetical protein [Gimesia fumaroli]QDV53710.1 hypothetical protein Enr17x_57910 [Gimesia fumaroli]
MDLMDMNPLMGLLILAGLYFAGQFLKKKKSETGGTDSGFLGETLENLTSLSSAMTAAGFKLLPQLPDALMKNDRGYVDKLIRQLMMAFNNPEQRQAELEEVFTKLLEEKFRDPDKRRLLLDRIERLRAAESAKPAV